MHTNEHELILDNPGCRGWHGFCRAFELARARDLRPSSFPSVSLASPPLRCVRRQLGAGDHASRQISSAKGAAYSPEAWGVAPGLQWDRAFGANPRPTALVWSWKREGAGRSYSSRRRFSGGELSAVLLHSKPKLDVGAVLVSRHVGFFFGNGGPKFRKKFL